MGWHDEYPLNPLPVEEAGDREVYAVGRDVLDAPVGGNLVLGVNNWLFGLDTETGAVDARPAGTRIDALAAAGETVYAANGMTVTDLVRGTTITAESRVRDIAVHGGQLLATSGSRVFNPATDETVADRGGDVLASFDGRLYHAVTRSVGQDRYGIYDSLTGEEVAEAGRVQDLTGGEQLYSVDIARPQGVGRAVHTVSHGDRIAYSSSGGDIRVAETVHGVYGAKQRWLYNVTDDPDFDSAVHSFPNAVNAMAAVPDEVYDALFPD